jgi:predicted unusual protein kinase regulating ubiquinone biosynthesis (AarF/ABC1/UbiB family)
MHGDPHPGNVMIKVVKDAATGKYIGLKTLMIDYGFALQVSPPDLQMFQQYANQKRYDTFISMLCVHRRRDGLDFRKYPVYAIVCNVSNITNIHRFNQSIQDTLLQKDDVLQKRITRCHEKHALDKHFPLLPLSNTIKHRMFQGYFMPEQLRSLPPLPPPVVTKPSKYTVKVHTPTTPLEYMYGTLGLG